MGISVGVENVSEGVASPGVCDAGGVASVGPGKLHPAVIMTITMKKNRRDFIHSSFADKILIRHLDYRNSSLGQSASRAFPLFNFPGPDSS